MGRDGRPCDSLEPRPRLALLTLAYRVAGFGPYAELLMEWEYVSDGRGFLPHENIAHRIEEQVRSAAIAGPSEGG